MTTHLHAERLRAVCAAIRATRAARLLDLGCGDGDLLVQLAADPEIAEIVGVDVSAAALDRVRQRLRERPDARARIILHAGSITRPDPRLAGFDCAALVEAFEHLPPERLSALERALFHVLRPRHVVLTTPNADYNPLLGVPPYRFRHPDHQFEWGRARFRHWCSRAARMAGYAVRFEDVAGSHPACGGATQMAVFDRTARTASG
jgi:3' terminal RNA ribose 2'-O-methyltransferase Hen1